MSNGSWNISGKSIGPFPDELRGLLWDTLGPAVSTSTIGATFINLAPSARSITVREDEWKANFEGLWNRADQDGLYDVSEMLYSERTFQEFDPKSPIFM